MEKSKYFDPFILGICMCGCRQEIPIRGKRGYLSRYANNHKGPRVKYNCNKCKDKNWIIQCKCMACDELLFYRDSFGIPREFAFGHAIRVRDQTGENNPMWKGGISFNKISGYTSSRAPDHPFAWPNGRILTHRLVMEKYLSELAGEEVIIPIEYDIHHKDGNKLNNEISNLEILTHSDHTVISNAVDTSNRFCSNPDCRDKDGYLNRRWVKDGKGGYFCNRCYMRLNKHKWKKKRKK